MGFGRKLGWERVVVRQKAKGEWSGSFPLTFGARKTKVPEVRRQRRL